MRIPDYAKQIAPDAAPVPNTGTGVLRLPGGAAGDTAAGSISKSLNDASAALGQQISPMAGAERLLEHAQKASAVLFKVAERQQAETDEMDFHMFKAESDAELFSIMEDIKNNGSYHDVLPRANEAWNKSRSDALLKLQNKRIAERAEQYLKIKTLSAQADFQGVFLARQQDYQKARFNEAADIFIMNRNSSDLEQLIKSAAFLNEEQKVNAFKTGQRRISLLNASDDLEALGADFKYSEKDYPGLLPEDVQKINAQLKTEIDRRFVYDKANEIFAKYGSDLPRAYEAVYSDSSIDVQQKDRIWQRVHSRHNEALQWEHAEERKLAKDQKQNLNGLFNKYSTTGEFSSVDQIEQMVANGTLSDDGARQYLTWSNVKARRSEMERKELQLDKGFFDLPEDEQISIMRKKAQVSDDEAKFSYNRLFNKVISGAGDPHELRIAYDMLIINRSEFLGLEKMHKRTQRAESLFMNSMQTTLRQTLGKYREAFGGIESVYINRAAYDFNNSLVEMELHTPQGREEAIKSLQTTLLKALDDAVEGKRLAGHLWGRTSAGEEYDKELKNINKMSEGDFIRPEDIVYPGKGQGANAERIYLSGDSVARSMVEGGAAPTEGGMYGARDGHHRGIDIPAEPGAKITAFDFGATLTVQKVAKGDREGNYVYMDGTLPDNRKIEVWIMHMEDGVPIKKGDTVVKDTLIGHVGKEPGKGSTGPHMHLQIKINGEYADPDKHLKSAATAQQKQRRPIGNILETNK